MNSDPFIREVEKCNQRGERMLSVVDLLEAGTIDRELTAYLMAAIGRGASFMTGANPGGAGKTTIMCALLSLLPPGTILRTADSIETIADGTAHPSPRACYICHEIRNNDIYSYLWDGALRAYFSMARVGHLMATTLHADTFEQARDQVCGENEVPAKDFLLMNLALFIRRDQDGRKVVTAWESDGKTDHARIYNEGTLDRKAARLADAAAITASSRRLDALVASGARTIAEVRVFLAGKKG